MTQPWMLLGGRIIQGFGAAAFVPSSLSLLTANFAAGSVRSRALAAYGAMAGGLVVGTVGGGVITELLGWRWIFLLNVPIVLIMLLPVHRVLVDSRDTSSPRGFGLGVVAGAVAATASQAATDETALTSGFLACLVFVVPALILVAIGARDCPPQRPIFEKCHELGETTG